MNESEQCEGCLSYSTGTFSVLCEDCLDKAAKYEITLRDKRFCWTAINKALVDLHHVVDEKDLEPNLIIQLLSSAIARLEVAEDDCREVKRT